MYTFVVVETDTTVNSRGQSRLRRLPRPCHCADMETREARLKRLGALVKRARRARGMRRVDDLADAAGIGRTTLVAIETGRKRVTDQMYAALELVFDLPIGTMEAVLAGTLDEFPASGYPPELYMREPRGEREQDILSVKGMSDEGKWRVVFGLREQSYDQRGAANSQGQSG